MFSAVFSKPGRVCPLQCDDGQQEHDGQCASKDQVAIQKSVPGEGVHWLVGRWWGEIRGLHDGRIGDFRVLVITRVEADGTVIGRWADRSGAGGEGTKFSFSGESLAVTTTYNNRVILRQVAPGRLTGSFLQRKTAKEFPVTMRRQ